MSFVFFFSSLVFWFSEELCRSGTFWCGMEYESVRWKGRRQFSSIFPPFPTRLVVSVVSAFVTGWPGLTREVYGPRQQSFLGSQQHTTHIRYPLQRQRSAHYPQTIRALSGRTEFNIFNCLRECVSTQQRYARTQTHKRTNFSSQYHQQPTPHGEDFLYWAWL